MNIGTESGRRSLCGPVCLYKSVVAKAKIDDCVYEQSSRNWAVGPSRHNAAKSMAIEVKAKYEYNSGHEDDLSFTVGQIITVIEEVDEEWYNGAYVDSQGKRHQGMFPRNFVTATTSHTVAPPLSTVKHGAAKETSFKSKAAASAGDPNASAKHTVADAPSTSVKSGTSPPPLHTNLKSNSRTPVREIQASHQWVCIPSVVLHQLTSCYSGDLHTTRPSTGKKRKGIVVSGSHCSI